MDINKSNTETKIKDCDNEEDEDSVELPPDTLAILQEFLKNKDKQTNSECEEMVEEDWVHIFLILAYNRK